MLLLGVCSLRLLCLFGFGLWFRLVVLLVYVSVVFVARLCWFCCVA